MLPTGATITNEGSLELRSWVRGQIINKGEMVVPAGAECTADFAGCLAVAAGRFTVNGKLNAPCVSVNGGVVAGSGLVNAPVVTVADKGGLEVDSPPAAALSLNSLTLYGTLTFVNNGTSLADYGRVSVSGAANLRGTIIVAGEFLPDLADSFTAVTTGQGLTVRSVHMRFPATPLPRACPAAAC